MARGLTSNTGLWAVRFAPDVIREAVFSYTVLAHVRDDRETQSDVKIIGQLVADARFDRPA